jgi:hypothetical protein
VTLKKLFKVYQENDDSKPGETKCYTNYSYMKYQLYKLLEMLVYSSNKFGIKIRRNLLDELCEPKGLLQGCPMSPTLYKKYIARAMKI